MVHMLQRLRDVPAHRVAFLELDVRLHDPRVGGQTRLGVRVLCLSEAFAVSRQRHRLLQGLQQLLQTELVDARLDHAVAVARALELAHLGKCLIMIFMSFTEALVSHFKSYRNTC